MPRSRASRVTLALALGLAVGMLALLLFARLSHPLLWHDEASTAEFGRRVLAYGYPKVHGEKGTLYAQEIPLALAVDESLDAYLGSPWGQYYFAAAAELLARRASDPYARTGLLRLPFALAGALGLLLLLLALLPAVGGPPSRRLAFALLYALCCAYSVSLQLHLREVRYYPLVVLLVGALVYLFLRRHCYASLGARLYGLWLTPLLFLLFNVFYPVFGAFAASAGLHALGRALRRPPGPGRARGLLADLLPLLAAGAAVLPLVSFYRLFAVTGALMERYDAHRSYAQQLADPLATLLRFEFLAPALVARLLVAGLRLARRGEPLGEELRRRLAAADFLSLFALVYLLLVARTPFFYERYFVALGPILIALLLLDVVSLYPLVRGVRRGVRRAALAGAAALAATWLVVLSVRLPEFGGRLYEIRNVYRGPLDHVIPYLLARGEHPEDLIIATNYEDPAYLYYLDCRVLVGFYATNLARDLLFEPDVIVPRPWPRGTSALGLLAIPARWEETDFPVENLRANNVPSLSPRNQAKLTHRFRSPEPPEGSRGLAILERIRGD